MRFHELMKETWKEGLGKKKKNKHKNPTKKKHKPTPKKTLSLDFSLPGRWGRRLYIVEDIAWELVHA